MAGATTFDNEPLSVPRAPRRHGVDLPDPKFRAPTGHTEVVRRTELLRRLDLARERRLVLLTAPAGYGKTTLLMQWTEASERPFAWLRLDERDGDPEVLANSIANALLTTGIEPDLRLSFVLVLDNAHVVPPAVLKDAVLGLLAWLPEGSQLAVASRCEPALGLGRMRAQRTLVEVDAEDLSMSAAEAAALLRQAGVDLEFSAVQSVVRRTEGWPAALELAAIGSAHRPELAGHLTHLSGDDHLISEYFRTEVLGPLAPTVIRFLTHASVLDCLSGASCDDVLARRGSASMLAELARANVPLRAVDASHEWYRLHGLFREMLQTELRRSEPELQPVLHRRAGDWYRRAGDVDQAIEHARRAEDLDCTGELLWANLPGYLVEGRNHLIQRWLTGVTAERATGLGRLALVAAHSHLALGSGSVAEQWARSAGVSLSETPEESTKPERAVGLIIEAWAARSGALGMRKSAMRAYELLPDDSPWRASCCFLRGTAALLSGDQDEAERWLEEGAARGSVLASDATSLCLAQLAVLAADRDAAEVASDLAWRARSIVQDHGLSHYPTAALVFAVSAAAGTRDGRVDEAKAAVAQCIGLLVRLDDSLAWYGAEVRILLARSSLTLGDVAGARQLLADASRLGRRTPDVVVFRGWFDEAWDQFDARAEMALTGAATLTTAELRVLRFLPTHYSFHEVAERLHVSANTVKTHVHAVYRKLDASSRSEAVANATVAGLLGG